MDYITLLKSILYIIITMSGLALVANIMTFINKKIDTLQTSDKLTNYTQLNKYIDTAQDVITNVVTSVSQTYVDTLKQNGTWNDNTAKIAKEKAIELAKTMLTEDVVNSIKEVYGDFGTYLDTMIESILRKNK